MPSRKERLKYVNTRIWKTDRLTSYPEQDNSHQDSIGAKAKFGVCFSGGGTRSAICTHGQLKALDDIGVLDKVGYLSCVSGGAWAAVPYTYLDQHWSDSNFFGSIVEPEKLTLEKLSEISDKNYLHSVTHASVMDDALEHWAKLAGDETFSRVIGDTFLEHFGLNSRDKFFAYTENHIKDILSRNEKMEESDFYTVRPGRPFLIASGALLRFGAKDYLFEMTPWYSGIQKLYESSRGRKKYIGGGFIESFAIDSDSPDSVTDNMATVRVGSMRHRFTLSDMLGTTGAAPSEVLNNIGLKFIGFPEFKHWPINNIGDVKAKEYEFGDGGNIENLGILPLLKRGVEKIIVFVNTKKPLSSKNPNEINAAVRALFEPGNVNHVFSKEGLAEIQNALHEKLESGEATICTNIHSVINNDHHGITGGNEVEILWVYNHNYKNWEDRLPAEVSNKIGRKMGKLANFPHFATFMENAAKLIDMHPIQANLLSNMSCSVVRDNAEDFIKIFSDSH